MFDLEKAIQDWRRALRKSEAMEDGYIEEMESHLRDEFENQIRLGLNAGKAFQKAVQYIGQADQIGVEYYKTNSRRLGGLPPWNSPVFMPDLLWNYFKIALRRIRREKVYTFVNISGLAIGMACTILILLWVQHEKSFDRFHENADRICRVYYTNEAFEGHAIYLPGPLTEYLKENYPEIVEATNYKHWKQKIAVGDKSFLSAGSYVDPSFFEMFTFPLVRGNPKTVFDNPNSIVITDDLANKFFGDEDPIEKTITYYVYSQKIDLKVAGVIQNVPQNSHMQFDFLIPYEIGYEWMKTWDNNSGFIYVMLHPESSYQDVSEKIAGVLKLHRPGREDILHLQLLKKIHLYSLSGGQIVYVYIFSVMALVVLLIACFNFMNLSTARSERRFKEIGIKKVVGSSRTQLIKQFLTESVLMAYISLVLALFFVQIFLPSINAILGTRLELIFSGKLILSLIAIALFTGILAGSYPAFYLSAFHPVAIIKGQFSMIPILKDRFRKKAVIRAKGTSLRRILVVVQFALSIFFIICVMVIHKQLAFIKNKDLGFEKEHIIVVESMGELKQMSQIIKNELLKFPDVQGVTFGAFSPFEWESSASTLHMNWTGKTTELDFGVGENYVDYDYVKTLGLKMVQGRFFSKEFPSDATNACVVNESAVMALNMKNPLGKKITWRPETRYENSRTIIGVVRDFNTQSLHREIRPFVLLPIERIAQYMGNYMYIKIESENISHVLRLIGGKIKEFVPNDPFAHYFLDEEMSKLYKSEQLTGSLAGYITFLAIFISCLGLLALGSFSAARRTKEIGVRKILGASVSKVVFMLTKDFTKWVILANLIAWPLAYFVLNKWLKNFAFRVGIDLWIFILSGALALFVAILLVSYQAMKAATANPVDSLRYE
jgi:putative ABC transport system permease protein